MKILAMLAVFALAGCSTLGGGNAQQAALDNVLLALGGQATGVYLNGGNCVAPPIPPELLNPCLPQPPTATPEQLSAALTACITNSVALIAVTKYAQRVCTPTVKLK